MTIQASRMDSSWDLVIAKSEKGEKWKDVIMKNGRKGVSMKKWKGHVRAGRFRQASKGFKQEGRFKQEGLRRSKYEIETHDLTHTLHSSQTLKHWHLSTGLHKPLNISDLANYADTFANETACPLSQTSIEATRNSQIEISRKQSFISDAD